MVLRKVTFRLYPTELLGLHQDAVAHTLRGVNAQSLQVTLKRLDLAFAAFYRRVKVGETPGFPRFKPIQRFSGWRYKTHGDGWRLHAGVGMKHGDQAVRRLATEHSKLANRRKDFLHQSANKLVKQSALIATEELNVKNMTASGGAYKTGLNRSILDTAPSTFLILLKSKAQEITQ